MTRVRFLAGARDFSLLQNPDGFATNPASYGYGYGGQAVHEGEAAGLLSQPLVSI
jgi:hypothetical protein